MDHFCYLWFLFVMLSCLLIVALWLPAGKGLTSWFSYLWCRLLSFDTFPCGVLGQVWGLLYGFLTVAFFLTFMFGM